MRAKKLARKAGVTFAELSDLVKAFPGILCKKSEGEGVDDCDRIDGLSTFKKNDVIELVPVFWLCADYIGDAAGEERVAVLFVYSKRCLIFFLQRFRTDLFQVTDARVADAKICTCARLWRRNTSARSERKEIAGASIVLAQRITSVCCRKSCKCRGCTCFCPSRL